MYLEKLLKIIQAQRHDFLNHFQVISGLLQLNKIDRVREYINQVSMEMAQLGKTARLNVPEITAVLLNGFYDASMSQIEIELTVDSTFDNCTVPGPVMGDALEYSLGIVISAMSSHEVEDKHLEVIISESEKNCICRLLFPELLTGDPEVLEKGLTAVSELLNPYGGRVNLAMADNGVEIFLNFPRKKLQSG
ncbi:MAG TPA: Spo0B domain-containing protein [Bacillota bacterium]|nr:Spo0B domain-containing protein [Bacillota bacterium]